MHKIIVPLLALAASLAAATSARADSVSFSGFAHGSQSVIVTLSAPNVARGPVTVNAGGFATVLNGGPSFETYCVDLYQTIAFGAPPYTEYSAPGTSHVFTNSNAYADLGRLYAEAGTISDAMHEAAFQIAVWEIAYESAPTYNLASGSATFSGGTAASSGALTLASTWLAGLGSGTGPSILVLDSPLHQDVIYVPVPEPATYAMMLAGLLGLTLAARSRGAATPVRRRA